MRFLWLVATCLLGCSPFSTAEQPGGADASTPPAPSPEASTSSGSSSALALSTTGGVLAPHLDVPQDFTVEAWVFAASLMDDESYFVAEDIEGDTLRQFRFGRHGTKLMFVMGDDTGTHGFRVNSTNGFESTTSLVPQVWTHVAVTKSGASFTFYVDGGVAGSFQNGKDFLGTTDAALRLGAREDSQGAFVSTFQGRIDDVRIWSTARSAVEITAAMRRELTAAEIASPGLVSYFRLDEGTGATTKDEKRQALPGMLVSTQWSSPGAF